MSSYWIDSTKDDFNMTKLDKDLETDVCIIGAGIFGLTTAYYLSKKGFNVVVLDKHGIGEKASGYTSAKITSQHGLIYDYLYNSFSKDFAKKYLYANEESIKNIQNIIETENIECDFETKSNYVYTMDISEVPKIEKEVDTVKSLGFDCRLVNNTDLPIKISAAIEFPNQAQFHPRKYMLGLAKIILNNGGKIFTNTAVFDVKKDDDYYLILTENNSVKCKYVVLASHYPFLNIPGFYFLKMYQDTSYVIGVDTKTKLFDGMYINSKSPIYSFRTAKYKDKEILLLGGAGHKTGNEVDYSSTYGTLEKEAKKLYPNCEILYRWNTRDCITLDKIPYIGEFSNVYPNIYIGTGFNKWGMTSSNVASNIITDKILGISNEYEDIFSSTRMSPIKNRWEMKNMIKESVSSIVINKFKIPSSTIDNIKNDNGAIVNIDGQKVGIYKDTSGNIFAVRPICTHLGCLLSWNNVDKTWDCPCHGSRFDYIGKNIYDPAIKNLEILDIDLS